MSKMAELATNPKTGAIVATVTAGTGTGSWFDWIPADIGLFAALIGVVLSLVLIVVHVGRFVIEYRQAALKMEIMKKQLAEKE